MVELECPWCEELGLLPFLELEQPEARFRCERCGTTIELAEEPVLMEPAA